MSESSFAPDSGFELRISLGIWVFRHSALPDGKNHVDAFALSSYIPLFPLLP
jgi:hypothetical protein